jgi:hypothetical protein
MLDLGAILDLPFSPRERHRVDLDRLRAASTSRACVAIHELVPVELAGGDVLVRATEQAARLDAGRGAEGEAMDVVELDLIRGATDPTALEWKLAPATVPLPDRPADVSGDVAAPRPRRGRGRSRDLGRRRLWVRRLLSWVLHEPAAPRLALEDEVEADLDDPVLGRARVRVREGVAGGSELVEEAAGDRHADAGALRVERPHRGKVEGGRAGSRLRRSDRWRRVRSVRRSWFGRPK